MRWKEPLAALFSSALLGACSFLVTFDPVPTGSTSTGGSGGSGGGPCSAECCSAADCPVPKDPCKKASCTASTCAEEGRPDGTAIATQTAHDCKKSVCQGGAVVTVDDGTDTLDDGNDCTTDVCEGGKPASKPADPGTACATKGGKVCDDMSACVGCLKDGDCPTDAPKCSSKACVPATCGDGGKNGMETDTDCGGPQCNACNDGHDCLADTDCKSKVCGGDKKCAVPTCTDKVENGSEGDIDCGKDCPSQCGPKQGCNIDADCTGGVCTGMNGTCVPNCQDGAKNNTESDVDCGGDCGACDNGRTCAGADSNCKSGYCNANDLCAVKSPNGTACASNVTCASGTCVDGVCCSSTCGGLCEACNVPGYVGTCFSIPAGLDPANECAGAINCNGAGACTSVNGTACMNDSDCISTFCTDGVCCDAACGGLCKRCNSAGSVGTCSNIAAGQDPDSECAGTSVCDGTGVCKKPNGAACNNNGECVSNKCMNGLCAP